MHLPTNFFVLKGFECGLDVTDQVNHIVADIGTLEWEKINPGTAYVVTSRAKTIGVSSDTNPYPIDSALFFDCQISLRRFTDVKYKNNGDTCQKVEWREKWVKHLHEKASNTSLSSNVNVMPELKAKLSQDMQKLTIRDSTHLLLLIIDMIKQPNEQWSKAKSSHLLPQDLWNTQ